MAYAKSFATAENSGRRDDAATVSTWCCRCSSVVGECRQGDSVDSLCSTSSECSSLASITDQSTLGDVFDAHTCRRAAAAALDPTIGTTVLAAVGAAAECTTAMAVTHSSPAGRVHTHAVHGKRVSFAEEQNQFYYTYSSRFYNRRGYDSAGAGPEFPPSAAVMDHRFRQYHTI